MNTLRCRIKEYIQPFERVLALQELGAVAGTTPQHLGLLEETSTEFSVRTTAPIGSMVRSLAYWEVVSNETSSVVTTQSLRESTLNIVRNGSDLAALQQALPFRDQIPFPNRRCLRYGTHGIHEYRGKFFPQLVRSLINISRTRPGGMIADPMSGSGTTAVEANLFGCTALGLDMNPLSVFLARTKCDLLGTKPEELLNAYRALLTVMLEGKGSNNSKLFYLATLPTEDQEYLRSWFHTKVLADLDDISTAIQTIEYVPARNLMWISLSNILRSVSWQKPDDLRVRKRVQLDVEIHSKKQFLDELGRSIRAVLGFLYQEGPVQTMPHSLQEGDARRCNEVWRSHAKNVDVVITSPPYATALPYLDTDRLSLSYLGLLSRGKQRSRDQRMIGNREVTERLRSEYMVQFESRGSALPDAVRKLIRRIESLNKDHDVGFRRRNLPALLSKYFFDMREVLSGIREILKPNGMAFVVVGNNHTIAGGQRVDIHTAGLLSEIAQTLGFDIRPSLSMDMLVSRDIFRKNAVSSEEILAFRKPTAQR